ncbi:MAG: M23 family metallopeptidase [Candidatus Nanopelagicales bacterium]
MLDKFTSQDRKDIGVALLAIVGVIASVLLGVNLRGNDQPDNPTPAVEATVPATPPPGMGAGVDGAGALPGGENKPLGIPTDLGSLTEEQRDGIVVEPDAGTDKGVTVKQTAPGVGGLKMVTSPAWKGQASLNAAEYYSNRTRHWAWDVGLWTGSNVFAAFDGKVVGLEDGTKNNPPGVNPGSGSPSNWILLCRKQPAGAPHAGKTIVLYYQHLSPGLNVKRGQNVKLGQQLASARIAKSGNSGFSTGPHLHIAAGISNIACGNISQWEAKYQLRYRYLQSKSLRVWPPSDAWAKGKPARDTSKDVNLTTARYGNKNASVKRLQVALRAKCAACKKINTGGATGYYGSQTRAMIKTYVHSTTGKNPASTRWVTSPTVKRLGLKPVAANVSLSAAKYGKSNTSVTRIQRALRSQGVSYTRLNPSSVTGFYGTETVRMVRQTRKSAGWTVGTGRQVTAALVKRVGLIPVK